MKKTAIAILTLLALTAVVTAQDQWIHVRVTGQDSGENFSLNLPLATIQTMLPSLAERGLKEGRAQLGHRNMSVADLRVMWQSVRDQGDFEIAQVEEQGMRLRVAMEGNHLIARTLEGSEQQIHVQLPAVVVDAVLSGEDDSLNLQAALDALAGLGSAEMVRFEDGKKSIKVWIDTNAAGN